MFYLVPAVLILVAWPEDDRSTRAWFGTGLVVVLIVAFGVTRPRWASPCPACRWRVRSLHVGAIGIAILGFGLGGPFQLAMLLVYPGFLFISSVNKSSRRHRVSQLRLLESRPRWHTKACMVYA